GWSPRGRAAASLPAALPILVPFTAAPPLVRTLIGLRRVDHPGGSARVRGARRARAAATAAQTSDVADAEATAATTGPATTDGPEARNSTRLNSSHVSISYAV